MSEIKALNLFRCSSAENGEEAYLKENQVKYFITDYFDGLKVEDLSEQKSTLSECMGIVQGTDGDTKGGISQQRYCLYNKNSNSGEEDLFAPLEELPILTVIQLFLNSDVYQAACFSNEDSLNGDTWMEKLENHIKKYSPKLEGAKWRLYQLLTAGDFAIVVRSKTVSAAYDLITIVRNIKVQMMNEEQCEKELSAFYSYSICGVLDNGLIDEQNDEKNQTAGVDWESYLSQKDQVVIRIKYTEKFRSEASQELKEKLAKAGRHLLGRYDHQIIFSIREFSRIYPAIRKYKFFDRNANYEVNGSIDKDHIETCISEKVLVLLEMMSNGYIAQINERLLLNYGERSSSSWDKPAIWQLQYGGGSPWVSLYDRNYRRIEEVEERINELDKWLKPFYKSSRNLKAHMRLAGRICKVLYELNKLHELRTGVANLSRQYQYMISSFHNYINAIPEGQERHYMGSIEANLRNGLAAFEIVTRYIRNVNLQTLQTPNYDLQTNVCIEKVLMAYSQFLQPYTAQQEEPYQLCETIYPIMVPSMSVDALSVAVLFDNIDREDGGKTSDSPKTMVVYSPTFSFLCETCFLIPAVFHEIAHHFRYETRKKRNECLKKYVLKSFLHNLVLDVIDRGRDYSFGDDGLVEVVVDAAYEASNKALLKDILPESSGSMRLQSFKNALASGLSLFISAVQEFDLDLTGTVKIYLEKTKGDIQRYDLNMMGAIQELDEALRNLEELEGLIADGERSGIEGLAAQMNVKYAVRKLNILQEQQLCEDMLKAFDEDEMGKQEHELKDAYEHLWEFQKWEDIKDRSWNEDAQIEDSELETKNIADENIQCITAFLENRESEEKGEEAFQIWNKYMWELSKEKEKELFEIRNMHLSELSEEKREEAFKIWDMYLSELPEENELWPVRRLLTHYHNVTKAYREFNGRTKSISREAEERNVQCRRLENDLRFRKIFTNVSQKLYQEIQGKLQEFESQKRNKLKWDMVSVPTEKTNFILKEIRLQGPEGMQQRLKGIFAGYEAEWMEHFVDQKIEFYREVTSDLFMCATMDLTCFGYLIVAAEMLDFHEPSKKVQLERVFLVLECLNENRTKKEEDTRSVEEEIRSAILAQTGILYKELQTVMAKNKAINDQLEDWVKDFNKTKLKDVQEIKKFLDKFETFTNCDLTSTQKWIIQVFREVIGIAYVLDYKESKARIGTKEIWEDLIYESSYQAKKEEIRGIMDTSGGGELCKNITEILNSPASFFAEKKSLLAQEIEFILHQYEESCKHIF